MTSLWIDLGAVLLILANMALGWRYGIVGRAIALGGLYGGVAAATALGNGLLRLFGGGGAANDLYSSAWMYVGIVFAVVAAVEILGALYRDRVEKLISLMFDRTSGIVGGLIIGVFEVAIITMVALAVGDAHASTTAQQIPADHSNPASAVRNSLIGSHVAGIDPAVRTIFGPALPESLAGHLADTTAVASK
ncbi:MAG TPA: CvpA family protein [Candidatus Dormibacteraeota bacterium]|jgi:uncharacterized membrane protein required for colicin V production|nr:CvpA family protein [Candidatus Dormibacteraeota bacterium]